MIVRTGNLKLCANGDVILSNWHIYGYTQPWKCIVHLFLVLLGFAKRRNGHIRTYEDIQYG
jgi:hypothetical protein